MKITTRRVAAGVAAAGILGTLAFSQALHAATATANLSVTATVVAQCSISAPTALAFGNYDPVTANASTNLDASTTISVACTKGTPNVWIGLNTGANASGSTRRMANGATERLTYELYSDSGRTTIWGNTQPTGVGYTSTSKAASNLSVYGRVPSGQDVAVGSYTDTVVATINF